MIAAAVLRKLRNLRTGCVSFLPGFAKHSFKGDVLSWCGLRRVRSVPFPALTNHAFSVFADWEGEACINIFCIGYGVPCIKRFAFSMHAFIDCSTLGQASTIGALILYFETFKFQSHRELLDDGFLLLTTILQESVTRRMCALVCVYMHAIR